MHELIEFLIKYSGSLTAISSIIVAVCTAIYAYLTVHLVRETKRLREAQTEPLIEIRYELSEYNCNIVYLVVRNIGAGPAYNLRFSWDLKCPEDIKKESSKILTHLEETRALKDRMEYLGPGQKFSTLLSAALREIDTELKIEFNCEYDTYNGIRKKKSYVLDLSELRGISYATHPLWKISESLENIHKDIKSITLKTTKQRN